MMLGGLVLLVIPAIIIATLYSFVPLIMMDQRCSIIEAMHASRAMVKKSQKSGIRLLSTTIILHLICLVLIFPTPITLPIFSVIICRLYEEISTL
jgi:uncharacterized membrane protein